MDALLHTLHIGTLATWLSVAGFGTVAVVAPNRSAVTPASPEVAVTEWLDYDFKLSGESPPATPDPVVDNSTPAAAEPMSAPPEPPDLTAMEPLPELPALIPSPTAIAKLPPARQHSSATGARPTVAVRGNPAAATGASAAGHPGSGMSMSARLAAGNMPSPVYPAEARRLGQTGTLIVEFTVDSSGKVIAAYAKSPSPWPLLNQEAVRTVRHWKFPPGGGVMKLQRPIVFQLR